MNPMLATGLFVGSCLPVFRSGIRGELNFWQLLWNHTVYGPYPLYVPRELAIAPDETLLFSEPQGGNVPMTKILPAAEIRFTDSVFLVQKRFGDEWRDLREWITPSSPKVIEYANMLYHENRDEYILNCWQWVCETFDYPRNDYHYMEAFGGEKKYGQEDFWHFPGEMLGMYEEWCAGGRKPLGDCDDCTFLLASLILVHIHGIWANICVAREAGHAWVSVLRDAREYDLETTLRGDQFHHLLETDPWGMRADLFPPPDYKYNHRDVIDYTS